MVATSVRVSDIWLHARTHGRIVLVGRLFPGLRLGGNRQVVAAECPEYRMSAVFFVYEVRWNALIWAVILCLRTVARFRV